jgi:hypothetical protein
VKAALCGLLAVVAFAVWGCGGSDDNGDDGMQRFDHDGVSISYPAGWARDANAEEQGKGDGLVLMATGPSGVRGVPYRVSLLDQPAEGRIVRGLAKFVSDTRPADLNGRHVEDGEFRLSGTPKAWRVVTDYKQVPQGGGDSVPARLVDIVWLAGDRQFNVSLAGPRDKMDAPEIQQVVGSLKAG